MHAKEIISFLRDNKIVFRFAHMPGMNKQSIVILISLLFLNQEPGIYMKWNSLSGFFYRNNLSVVSIFAQRNG
jgi:hypothetical protein